VPGSEPLSEHALHGLSEQPSEIKIVLHKVDLGFNQARVSSLVRTSNEEIPSNWGAPTHKMKNSLLCKGARGHTQKEEEEIRIGIKMPARVEDKERPSGTQDYWDCAGGNLRATPYNNRFDRNSVVRHAPCLRKGRAGTAVSLLLRRRETAQRCPLNRALYGRNKLFLKAK
jgi:hypothetical protein